MRKENKTRIAIMAAVAAGAIPTAAAATHILQYLNPEEPPVDDAEFDAARDSGKFELHHNSYDPLAEPLENNGVVSVTNFDVEQDAPTDLNANAAQSENIVIQRLDLANENSPLDLIDLEQSPVINLDEYDLVFDDYNSVEFNADDVVQTELYEPIDTPHAADHPVDDQAADNPVVAQADAQSEVNYLGGELNDDLSFNSPADNAVDAETQEFDYFDDSGIDSGIDDPGMVFDA